MATDIPQIATADYFEFIFNVPTSILAYLYAFNVEYSSIVNTSFRWMDRTAKQGNLCECISD